MLFCYSHYLLFFIFTTLYTLLINVHNIILNTRWIGSKFIEIALWMSFFRLSKNNQAPLHFLGIASWIYDKKQEHIIVRLSMLQ